MKHGIKIIAVILCFVLWCTLPAGAVFAEPEEESGSAAETLTADLIPETAETDPAADSIDAVPSSNASKTDTSETAEEDHFTEAAGMEHEAAFSIDELEMEEEAVVNPASVGENDELLSDYLDISLGVSTPASLSRSGAERWLSGADKTMYHFLKDHIQAIASGTESTASFSKEASELGLEQTSWTAEDLGLSTLGSWNASAGFDIDPEAEERFFDAVYDEFSLSRIISSLLYDMPYDLYWYEKTAGTKMVVKVGIISQPVDTVFIQKITFNMVVAEEYADQTGQMFTDSNTGKRYPLSVDPEIIGAVNQTADTINRVIREQDGKSDFEKLLGYKNTICDLTDYNWKAADSANHIPYGNPWQLIWVFDEDPETKVVCEGYSKAFQYLCDLSSFQSRNVESRIVTGKIQISSLPQGHMWNLVTMEDGNNYLVDVTNCDIGTNGASNRLFMVGASSLEAGAFEKGYTVFLSTSTYRYFYDTETISAYHQTELTVGSSSYSYDPDKDCANGGFHRLSFVAGEEAGCETEGRIDYRVCSVCHKLFRDPYGEEEITEADTRIPATGHRFGSPEWTWSSDLTGAEAAFICQNDPSHVVTREAVVTENGLSRELAAYVYTAELRFAGKNYTDSARKPLPKGWIQIDDTGDWYYVKAEGRFARGWLNDRGIWYYMDPADASMKTGWQRIGGTWYYLRLSGAMAVGWIKDGKDWYYLNSSGAMTTGWQIIGGTWYYLGSYGAMQTGWQRIGQTWYYLKPSGAMASEEWCGGYWLSRSGAWTYYPKGSWKRDSEGWWFGDTSGWYAKQTGQIIDDVYYLFDEEGYWIPE